MLRGPWEIRVHRIEAPEGASVREGGHAESPAALTGPGWAPARTADGVSSAVIALHGWGDDTEEGTAEVARDVQSNAFGPRSAIPYLRLDRHFGGRSTAARGGVRAGGRREPHGVAGVPGRHDHRGVREPASSG